MYEDEIIDNNQLDKSLEAANRMKKKWESKLVKKYDRAGGDIFANKLCAFLRMARWNVKKFVGRM